MIDIFSRISISTFNYRNIYNIHITILQKEINRNNIVNFIISHLNIFYYPFEAANYPKEQRKLFTNGKFISESFPWEGTG